MNSNIANVVLFYIVPGIFVLAVFYAFYSKKSSVKLDNKYRVKFKLSKGNFTIANLRRGVSVIGAAGSGKTESVIYNFLQHFTEHKFYGIIHDYKHFEITEIAYPLFKAKDIPFYTIAFDEIHYRVNPIAPRYLPNEESVNEISKVLLENLLEHSLSENTGSNKFFTDAVEGLLSGLIWKMKASYPQYCTIPHIIAAFQSMSNKMLIDFLKSDLTSKSLAGAFLNGLTSDKQTAGVK
ncbi:MAG: type IV secretory system conjugative DNA transfer family protein, partial [Flavobacteriaceae bacterium]|nr:type IV secretory system conjugative DNA transfer family protein [Flavobacteriaceae bacterium]